MNLDPSASQKTEPNFEHVSHSTSRFDFIVSANTYEITLLSKLTLDFSIPIVKSQANKQPISIDSYFSAFQRQGDLSFSGE